jgi:hypothetical protein
MSNATTDADRIDPNYFSEEEENRDANNDGAEKFGR